jgi:hypothetical protein
MRLLFLASVLVIGYAYLGYPLMLMILSIFRNQPIRKAGIHPIVAIIITAFNEQARIRENSRTH